MNPILAEDIMRQRAHRSLIVLATLLAWLLVTPDRASAEGITVIVPVNMTNFHEDVERVFVQVRLKQGSQIVGENNAGAAVVDGSVQEDVEVSITQPSSGENIFDADVFVISLILRFAVPTSRGSEWFFCTVNKPYEAAHPCGDGRNMMQTYEELSGPISDLIPE